MPCALYVAVMLWQLTSWYSGRTHSNDKIRAMVVISILYVATLKVKLIGCPYFRTNVSPLTSRVNES